MATNNSINSQDPIQVALGGTGNSTLTAHGVLVGEGTSAITPITVGTNGQLLLGATSADPAFATLTSTASSITYTTGANSLNLDLTNFANAATSWTPTLSFGGGTTGITYTVQKGIFSQIGNLVTFGFSIAISSKGSSTGTAEITLPSTPNSTLAVCAPLHIHAGLTYGGTQVAVETNPGQAFVWIVSFSSAGGLSLLSDTAFASNTAIDCQGFYFV